MKHTILLATTCTFSFFLLTTQVGKDYLLLSIMGISQRPLISSLDLSDPLWTKVLEKSQLIGRKCSWQKGIRHIMKKEKCRSILMKRRVRRRSSKEIEKKVKMLEKLIPNRESSSSIGLFRETADYIWGLEMRVKVMQIIVNVLSTPHIN